MFLGASQVAFSNEHNFMKPIKSAHSHQYQSSTAQNQFDGPYPDEIYSIGFNSTKISQKFPPKNTTIESPNISHADGAHLQRRASGSMTYDADSSTYLKVENDEILRSEYGLESPLQAFQTFSTIDIAVPQENSKQQYEIPAEVLNQRFIQTDTFEMQRNPELYGKREFPDYGFQVSQKLQEEQLQPPMQQFSPPNQLQMVNQQQYLEEPKLLLLPPGALPQGYEYPDMTTMINASTEIVGPLVEMKFVDHKVCQICNKRITRDMCRHMRTHQTEKRFVCVFPKQTCGNKSNQFNRRYDYTKHLLNKHFVYDDPEVVKRHTVREKVSHWGTCVCGQRFLAQDWINWHILTKDEALKCPITKATNNL